MYLEGLTAGHIKIQTEIHSFFKKTKSFDDFILRSHLKRGEWGVAQVRVTGV